MIWGLSASGHQARARAAEALSGNQGIKAQAPAGTKQAPAQPRRLKANSGHQRAPRLGHQRAPSTHQLSHRCSERPMGTTRAPRFELQRAPSGHRLSHGGSERPPKACAPASGHQVGTSLATDALSDHRRRGHQRAAAQPRRLRATSGQHVCTKSRAPVSTRRAPTQPRRLRATSGHQAGTKAQAPASSKRTPAQPRRFVQTSGHQTSTKARAPTGTKRAPGLRTAGRQSRHQRLGHRRTPSKHQLSHRGSERPAGTKRAPRLGHQQAGRHQLSHGGSE